ncbi:MAG: GFA family protein [Chitinophagaceae bacterium]|nr:GFA family protein [Rubrivivax sp.]
MMRTDISCLCGAVQVQLEGAPSVQFYCHCDDCQATSGGAYVGVALYPASAVTVLRGELVSYALKTMPRKRCAVCGTSMLAVVPGRDQIGIKSDRLPAGLFAPAFHENCRYALHPIKDPLPHYKGYPALFGGSDELVGW